MNATEGETDTPRVAGRISEVRVSAASVAARRVIRRLSIATLNRDACGKWPPNRTVTDAILLKRSSWSGLRENAGKGECHLRESGVPGRNTTSGRCERVAGGRAQSTNGNPADCGYAHSRQQTKKPTPLRRGILPPSQRPGVNRVTWPPRCHRPDRPAGRRHCLLASRPLRSTSHARIPRRARPDNRQWPIWP